MLDHETFEVKGAWEQDRGPQYLAYDFWWHLGHDTMITSEWGTPNMVKDGVNPELLLGGKYGNALHVWDLQAAARTCKKLDLGAEQQMVLELRPAHNPRKAYGFVGRGHESREPLELDLHVVSRHEPPASWADDESHRDPGGAGGPGRPAAAAQGVQGGAAAGDRHQPLARRSLPLRVLLGHGRAAAVRRDRPVHPKLTGSVKIGGIVRRTPHPKNPAKPLNGGPQMVEVSRDGRRVYVTNSLYTPWDAQFYPDGIRGWMAKVDANPSGGIAFDPRFLVEIAGRAAAAPGAARRAATRRPTRSASRDDRATHPDWVSIALLGGLHGVNPAMGWLFAVSLGLQAQSSRAVWSALAPLALGHALAVAAALAAAAVLGIVLPLAWSDGSPRPRCWVSACCTCARTRIRAGGGVGGMCVGPRELTTWSFLVSSAHGAGLMVLPFVLGRGRRQRAQTRTRTRAPAVTPRTWRVSSYRMRGTDDGAVRDAAAHRRLLRRGGRDRMGRLRAARPALPAQCVDQHERRLGRRTDRDRRATPFL